MDAERFDRIAKGLSTPANRRATLGAALGGGLLGALGLRPTAAAPAAQRGTCSLDFVATVRLGPSTGQAITPDGNRPGELRGELTFALSGDGKLENASLTLPDGTALPAVGQATGHALHVRIELEPRVALVATGVGEEEIAACQGAIDGVAAGPAVGDLGDWHAAARGGGNQAGGSDAGQGGSDRAANRANRANRDAQGGQGGQGGDRERAGDGRQSQGQGQAPRQAQGAGGSGSGSSSSGSGSCAAGLVLCDDGECHDLSIERQHCGACGNACVFSEELCQNGVCVPDPTETVGGCPQGTRPCDGECLDVFSDAFNCGRCGVVCPENTPVCSGGRCVETQDVEGQGNGCGAGLFLCDGVCVDVQNDPDNCGACGVLCPVSPSLFECVGGVCTPPTCDDLTDCGGLCVDLLTDSLHCGACGNTCLEEAPCQQGVCTPTGGGGCAVGLMMCGGVCVDPGGDNANCGGCGNVCAEPARCVIGACVVTEGGGGCRTGLTGCGGTCVDLATNSANCGGCGVACPEGTICGGGVCAIGGQGCRTGLTLCNGICVDLQTDPVNCGACGVNCGGAACAGGVCEVVQAAAAAPALDCAGEGLDDCGGFCVDVASDGLNCGGCGVACGEGEFCLEGVCGV